MSQFSEFYSSCLSQDLVDSPKWKRLFEALKKCPKNNLLLGLTDARKALEDDSTEDNFKGESIVSYAYC